MGLSAVVFKNIRHIVAAVLMLSSLITNGWAQQVTSTAQAASPFYAAFKKYCIDSAVMPGTIDELAKADGGVLFDPYSNTPPGAAPPHHWKVRVGERAMVLRISPVVDLKQKTTGMSCNLHSVDVESASLPLLADWAAVPRDAKRTYADIYAFVLQGTTHQPFVGDVDTMVEGWMLYVDQRSGTDAALIRFKRSGS